MESYNASLPIAAILLNSVGWSFCLVYKVWVENIEFIALHNLWRWIVMIIVSLIIFVPLVSSVNTVEILWLPGPVFVMPPINLLRHLSIVLETVKDKENTVDKHVFLLNISKYILKPYLPPLVSTSPMERSKCD